MTINIEELRDRARISSVLALDYKMVTELLDRLEAAEKECDFAKEEAERLLALAHDQNNELIRLREEGRTLQAKIEQMESQRPEPAARTVGMIGEWVSNGDGTYNLGGCLDAFVPLPDGTLLYALPGAQGEGK